MTAGTHPIVFERSHAGRVQWRVLGISLLTMVVAGDLSGQAMSFSTRAVYPGSRGADAVALADFDGDGMLDMAIT